MRKFVPVIFLVFLCCGCKKTIEKLKENAVISAMTDGQWKITFFDKNGSVITTEFSGYKFQYHKNYTVDAIKDGVVEKSGTWNGDPNTMTITANFTGAIHPLDLINGSWHIDKNSWTFVEASQTGGVDKKKLRLDKL